VAERGREFAIRSALGARAVQILNPLLKQGAVIVGIGAAIGIAAAWRAGKWLQPLLYQVRLLEPWVVYAVVGTLLLASIAAALGPARKASVADPMEALRGD
jgi:ABC-type antimicrobial peptide transport system permease subunit